MCGFAGFWALEHAAELGARAAAMAATLAHRGPDGAGAWVDQSAGAALAFRRLAIIDLSDEGRQPMASESGRYVITFNGEIYNFPQLRAELEPRGHRFRGHSDTEVMLAAIEEWGLAAATARFIGMFAFALWDARERRMSLVRDRLGIKPLYYGRAGSALVFGSELKALLAYPGFRPAVDRGALSLYLRHSYVPTPYSIYQGVRKLTPGCILTIDDPQATSEPVPFWSARDAAQRGIGAPFDGPDAEALERLEALLRDAVGLRLVSDVPLGAFLSGGIDSSLVVALMQAQSGRPVRTFTIGFEEGGYDEAPHARAVAAHLGTDHTELYVTPDQARAVIPALCTWYDEPFGDSSQIPTFLVSELARRHVTVSLSGDGGDELFGGYTRYAAADAIWRKVGRLPLGLRRAAGRRLAAIDSNTYDRWLGWLEPGARRGPGAGGIAEKIRRVAEAMVMETPEALYTRLMSHWDDPAALVIGGSEPPTSFTDRSGWPATVFPRRMMFLDTVSYLPDDILTKVDRASMAVGLEARVPLLDHRVMEFSWRLPSSMLRRDGQGKWALRKILSRYVPPELVDRPKRGFAVPIAAWLRGPLRDWAEALIDERRLRDEGFLAAPPIREKWKQHLGGDCDWSQYLWDVLMFQAWRERWM